MMSRSLLLPAWLLSIACVAALGCEAETATDPAPAPQGDATADATSDTTPDSATDAATDAAAPDADDTADIADAEPDTTTPDATDAAADTATDTATDTAADTNTDAATDTATDTKTDTATDTSNVQSMCAALQKTCEGEGYCYDVTDSTCAYLAEKKLSHPACDEIAGNKSVAACVSSITDKSSPHYGSDECPLVQYWSNPSDFPIDCRCAGKFENECKRPYNLEPKISFGEGPRMRSLASTIQAWNGTVENGEWLLPVGWSTSTKKNQTMIFGIDMKTGKRRHVSGAYDDPSNGYTQVGAGPTFVNVMDIKKGPDGKFYAVGAISDIGAPKIWRFDPTTGDRELLFDEEVAIKDAPSTLCPNYSTLPGRKVVQMVPEGFAMDAAGNFYFSIINMPGRGIVKLAPDFKSCSYLTLVADPNQQISNKENVGAGYDSIQFNMRALEIVEGKLYGVSDTKLIEVDLATGARKLISNAKEMGGLGSGPINAEGLADRWSRWDPYRKVLWTHGIKGGSGAIVVDLESGDRTPWPCWHPTLGKQGTCGNTGTALIPGYLNFGGMVIDPSPPHDLYFAHDLFSVVKYEIKTGNSYIFSL